MTRRREDSRGLKNDRRGDEREVRENRCTQEGEVTDGSGSRVGRGEFVRSGLQWLAEKDGWMDRWQGCCRSGGRPGPVVWLDSLGSVEVVFDNIIIVIVSVYY